MSSSSFRLIVRTGPNPGMVFELSKEVTLLGRDVTNDIVLGDAEVSRQHARIEHTPGGHVLEDLGSTNGSFVNGERLMSPRVLNSGDLIGLGENVTLTFEAVSPDEEATVASPAVAQPSASPQPQPVIEAEGPTPSPMPRVEVPSPAVSGVAEAGKRRLPLALAGGGCLILLLACAAVMNWMPLAWWCSLLSPLRFVGIYFEGC